MGGLKGQIAEDATIPQVEDAGFFQECFSC